MVLLLRPADDSAKATARTEIAREVVLAAPLGNHIHHCKGSN